MKCVNIIDVLFALVDFSLDPMSIEVSEEMIIVLGSIGVSLPLADVECEQGLVGVGFGGNENALKMFGKIFPKKLIEFFTKKMRTTVIRTEGGLTRRQRAGCCLLRCAKIMDSSVDTPRLLSVQ